MSEIQGPPHIPPAAGARRLLRRIRDIMASPAAAQEKLDTVVRIVAADVVAEVCSIYLLRAGEVLELFATEGLNREAVHKTRLRVGEGLVGGIAASARPLNLPEAQLHPDFAYRPETGEEVYQSLMGVPILRGGRVLGVIVVQNRTKRQYADEEVEALQTIAMVLAELVAGGQLIGAAELLPADGNALLPLRLEGIRLNGGLARGVAVLHDNRVVIERLVAEDPAIEKGRLEAAVAQLHDQLDRLLDEAGNESGEHRDVLEAFRMVAADRGWLTRIGDGIESGLTAEAAVLRAHDDTRARMAQVTTPYLRERLQDFEDLTNRLLQHLVDGETPRMPTHMPEEVIVVARNMGPAELLDYDRARLRGVVLEEGSQTSHVAIVARALDIPVMGRVSGVLHRVEPNDPVLVDGDNGQVFVRPGEDVLTAFQESMALREERRAAYEALRDLPARTRDGAEVELHLNAGLLIDLQHLDRTGAHGIGLYRTEIPFMVRSEYPDIPAQRELYKRVLSQAGGKPVVFRTLDVGADKKLPYFQQFDDDNPAMGWRAIRIALDRPAMLRKQLRALLAAAGGHDLHIMFPMISEVAEFRQARALLDLELKRNLNGDLTPPRSVQAGAMLEVPALAWQLPELLEHVDFLSIGSNDLMQFFFAADRDNPRLADRYDVLSPPPLRLLRDVVRHADAAGVRVSLCGEMAGRPLEAMTLLGLGIRCLSMAPASVGPVKKMIRSLDLRPLSPYLDRLIGQAEHSLRDKLRAFAVDHGVEL